MRFLNEGSLIPVGISRYVGGVAIRLPIFLWFRRIPSTETRGDVLALSALHMFLLVEFDITWSARFIWHPVIIGDRWGKKFSERNWK